jgi:hypothetical protein
MEDLRLQEVMAMEPRDGIKAVEMVGTYGTTRFLKSYQLLMW